MNSREVVDFSREVLLLSEEIPVVVDFWAEWCGPCRVLGPVLEKIAAAQSGRFVLVKVDTEAHQDLAMQYGIRSIPAVKLFVDGKVVDEFTGALPESAILQWLEKSLPDPDGKLLDEAEALLNGERKEEARSTIESVLRRKPQHERARVLRARMLLPIDPVAAAESVADIEAHSDQFPSVEMIRTLAALAADARDPSGLPEGQGKDEFRRGAEEAVAMNFDAALGHFIEVIRTDRWFHDDAARMACIAIFRHLGDDHQITVARRREFSSALNS